MTSNESAPESTSLLKRSVRYNNENNENLFRSMYTDSSAIKPTVINYRQHFAIPKKSAIASAKVFRGAYS